MIPEQQSVCSCEIGAGGGGTAGGQSIRIQASPIWNIDARKKCPATCSGHGRHWTGQWVTTVPGRLSVCECAQ